MRATATKVGSGHEAIYIDGVLFLKKVKAGRWSHITKLVCDYSEILGTGTETFYGKSASADAAEKFQGDGSGTRLKIKGTVFEVPHTRTVVAIERA